MSGPSVGAQNILLMGLESRTDWNGNILPNPILAALHAGSRQEVEAGAGGNATNTLILIHIPAGGGKATGFSIPRDDWVNFAGTIGPQQVGKVDQAYGVSLAFKEQALRASDPQMSQDQVAKAGNEAGQAAAVATVEKLTGVHIDHFAAINLDGFYELAKVLGGVDACLNHPVALDPNSGFHSGGGYQHLDARMALAFVRQRDGLLYGDLDRTHRQQAFLISVLHQLRTEGVLNDLGKISSLLSVAQRYVITDDGWNLLDFVQQMRGVSSGNITFYTLPITGYAVIDSQDANTVDPAAIKRIVRAAFYPPPPPSKQQIEQARASAVAAAHTTVDVLNGGNTPGLAGQVSAALVHAGFRAGQVGNTAARSGTVIHYGPGVPALAVRNLAKIFGATASARPGVRAGQVEVLLGASATLPHIPPALSPRHAPAPPTTGAQGGPVTAGHGHGRHQPRSVHGVPCVN